MVRGRQSVRTLDHIAIAVADLPEGIKRFAEDFGLSFAGTEEVEPAQTATAFFPVSTPTQPARIELVSPLRGGGPIAAALATRSGNLRNLASRRIPSPPSRSSGGACPRT